MLEETGVVVERLKPNRVMVRVSRSASCEHCAAAGACQALAGAGEMLVEVRDETGAKPGQRVVIAIGEKTLLWASFLVYILPLVGLFIGVSLAQWLAPADSQAWTVGGGFLGLILGFWGIYRYSRRLKQSEYLPVVIRLALQQHLTNQ